MERLELALTWIYDREYWEKIMYYHETLGQELSPKQVSFDEFTEYVAFFAPYRHHKHRMTNHVVTEYWSDNTLIGWIVDSFKGPGNYHINKIALENRKPA